jgi:hypothetical protein
MIGATTVGSTLIEQRIPRSRRARTLSVRRWTLSMAIEWGRRPLVRPAVRHPMIRPVRWSVVRRLVVRWTVTPRSVARRLLVPRQVVVRPMAWQPVTLLRPVILQPMAPWTTLNQSSPAERQQAMPSRRLHRAPILPTERPGRPKHRRMPPPLAGSRRAQIRRR